MATTKQKEDDAGLPFAALQLLAPPVRLVSAALWKVLKQRDVMQYGVVEEVVTSACETVPGLLTARHQGKLALGLRARLILELCCTQPDVKVIMPHLQRIRAPAAFSPSSAPTRKKDVKIKTTVEGFHSLVHALLKDKTERDKFFKEDFPLDYGPKFDEELEKLLWEFLIRLDQLLPVPNLAQTVSWLSGAPPVLEECARAATQPQLLKVLLQHETCLGHLEAAASLPPNMGDSILTSLSLPPSGRMPSNQTTGAQTSAVDQSVGTQSGDKAPFITPVIGLISNEDVPAMMRTLSGAEPAASKDATHFTGIKQPKDDGVKAGEGQVEIYDSNRSGGMKRKQPDEREGQSDEEEDDVIRVSRSGRKRILKRRSYRRGVGKLGQETGDQRTNESEEDVAVRKEERDRADLETCMSQLGVETLHLPEDSSLCSVVWCLRHQPRVVIEKLPASPAGANETLRGGKSSCIKRQSPRRKSPVKAPTRKSIRPLKRDSDFPGLDDKENHPVLPSISSSPSRQRSNTEMSALPGDGDDYVADSEDEATKNFKSRLFMKRYCKTKHGTYVPTLREYWKPGMTRRDLSSAGSKRR